MKSHLLLFGWCAKLLFVLPATAVSHHVDVDPLDVDVDPLARTTRIIQPAVRRAFYLSGGRHLVGRNVHLHVETSVFLKQPRQIPSQRQGKFLVFANRTVPIQVYSGQACWIQVSRHLKQAKEICIQGRLAIPDHDPRRRVHLQVKKMRRAPGSW